MSQIIHNHDFKWNWIYAKRNVNFVIFKLQQIGVISKLYTKTHNFIKIPFEYLVSTLLKLKNTFCSSFLWTFTEKERENLTGKKEFMTKHCMFEATNLRQPQKFYTTAGFDGWDI